VLLLACSCASVLLAAELGQRRAAAAAALGPRIAHARDLAQRVAALETELTGRAPGNAAPRAADAAVAPATLAPPEQAAAILLLLRASDARFGVRWRTLSLGGQLGSGATGAEPGLAGLGLAAGAGRNVEALFAPLADAPGVRVARLHAEGDYRNLTGLLDMIDAVQQRGTAITELVLDGEQVTMSGFVVARAP
jgi:hypothetical protein